MSRRSVLIGGGLGAAALLAGRGPAGAATGSAGGAAIAAASLAAEAKLKGIIYGSSTATWQFGPDPDYAALFKQQAGALFTEDDLLWYRLRPSATSGLDFSFGDQIVAFAESAPPQPVVGAHLVWDEGFGEGWTEDQLFGMTEQQARDILFSTIDAEVARYRDRVGFKAWVAANEVTDAQTTDPNGYRTNVPWYQTIGPEYVAEVFQHAHAQDPDAMLIINDFGFETGQQAVGRRAAFLRAIDFLKSQGVPVHAAGIQAHLTYQGFARQFNTTAYRQFLANLAARGLTIMITEMDVLDDGLRGSTANIDAGVADVYSRYLSVALAEPAVKVVLNFGLSDRYTWLQEDFPRRDGIPRRPLPFDDNLQPKPAYNAIFQAFTNAPARTPLPW